MTTIVNTPAGGETDSSNSLANLLVGMMLLLMVGIFLFYFLPTFARQFRAPTQPNISVPDKIDVNVNTPNNPAPAGQ
jgi:hypothetical protein